LSQSFMALEQSANFSEEVRGRAEEESVLMSKAAKEAGMYSPLLDDTKNISKTEQTSIVCRYFDQSTKGAINVFLDFH